MDEDSIEPLQLDIDYRYHREDPNYTPLNVKESTLVLTLEDYYSMIPANLLEVCQPIDLLIKEALTGVNPCWYWMTTDYKITGLFVFSYNHQVSMGKFIRIHHLSCLNASNFVTLLESTVNFLWRSNKVNYVRADLYNQSDDLPQVAEGHQIGYTGQL